MEKRRLIICIFCLLGMLSCAQEKELTIRTSFYENSKEFLLSDDPDLLDMLDYVLTMEYGFQRVHLSSLNTATLEKRLK